MRISNEVYDDTDTTWMTDAKLLRFLFKKYLPNSNLGGILRCNRYNHKDFKYEFYDTENDEYWCIDGIAKALRGFGEFRRAVMRGTIFCDVTPVTITNPTAYDLSSVYAIVQYCLWKDIEILKKL